MPPPNTEMSGVLLQEPRLQGEALGQIDVVGVGAGDPRRPDIGEGVVQVVVEPPRTGIARHPCAGGDAGGDLVGEGGGKVAVLGDQDGSAGRRVERAMLSMACTKCPASSPA